MWIRTPKGTLANLNKFYSIYGDVEESLTGFRYMVFGTIDTKEDIDTFLYEGSKEECEAIMEFISKKMNAYHIKDMLKQEEEVCG